MFTDYVLLHCFLGWNRQISSGRPVGSAGAWLTIVGIDPFDPRELFGRSYLEETVLTCAKRAQKSLWPLFNSSIYNRWTPHTWAICWSYLKDRFKSTVKVLKLLGARKLIFFLESFLCSTGRIQARLNLFHRERISFLRCFNLRWRIMIPKFADKRRNDSGPLHYRHPKGYVGTRRWTL